MHEAGRIPNRVGHYDVSIHVAFHFGRNAYRSVKLTTLVLWTPRMTLMEMSYVATWTPALTISRMMTTMMVSISEYVECQ